ncbi:hypothetical protein BDZ97DRAFT_1918479 [Flammula alnicola]|nr:hypothetical protein BDZ97DRAFT_1918479 [Flammula alnicola]
MPSVYAYVPAFPTNSTQIAVAGGLNVTDVSTLRIEWYANGSYLETVSYQLGGPGSSRNSKGALVHFSEDTVNDLTPRVTTTPWIALVSCDRNATNATTEEDIFTLARSKGAVSALLYSLYSVTCVINPEYFLLADSSPPPINIFSPQSLAASHLIEYQFEQIKIPSAQQPLTTYDSGQLNNSANAITQFINTGLPVSPGYLFTVLEAFNVSSSNSSSSTPKSSSSWRSSKVPPNIGLLTALACLSFLFSFL